MLLSLSKGTHVRGAEPERTPAAPERELTEPASKAHSSPLPPLHHRSLDPAMGQLLLRRPLAPLLALVLAVMLEGVAEAVQRPQGSALAPPPPRRLLRTPRVLQQEGAPPPPPAGECKCPSNATAAQADCDAAPQETKDELLRTIIQYCQARAGWGAQLSARGAEHGSLQDPRLAAGGLLVGSPPLPPPTHPPAACALQRQGFLAINCCPALPTNDTEKWQQWQACLW